MVGVGLAPAWSAAVPAAGGAFSDGGFRAARPEDEAAPADLERLQAITDRVNEAIARILADAERDVADRRARRERWMGNHASGTIAPGNGRSDRHGSSRL